MDHIWSCIGLNHEKFSKSKQYMYLIFRKLYCMSGMCIVCQEFVLYVSVSHYALNFGKVEGAYCFKGLSVRLAVRLSFRASVKK